MAQNKNIPPPAQFIDPATGYLTRAANNFLNSITRSSNMAAAGEVATPAGSGLDGGGQVSDGITLSIAPAGVTNAMLRDSQPFSVIGRYSSTVGSPADIVATADDRVLARVAGVLAFYPLTSIPGVVADGDYGDITVTLSGSVWTIDANVVSNSKLAQVATARFKGRVTAATGNVEDLTGTQATTLLDAFTSSLKGLAPASGGGTANYLRADGSWAAPPGATSGTVTSVSVVTANGFSGSVATATTTPAITLSYAGAALTKTDDTNVTLTLGGTPATALLAATSITVGWTGTLAPSRGGTGISSLGTGVATALGINVGSAGAFVTFNGALGTPSSGTATNLTGLPISTGVSGLGSGVATLLATFSSANLRSALTDETGTGSAVFADAPTFNVLTSQFTSTAPSLSSLTGAGIVEKGSSGVYITHGSISTNPYSGWVQATDIASAAYPYCLNPLGGNVGFGTLDQFGGGSGVIGIANAASVPSGAPTGGGVLYVEGGALKFRGSSGTITTIAPA